MKRSIEFHDKHKEMIKRYESELGKEEFAILISKLLKVNQELSDKHMDLFMVCELLMRYNIDFYSLISLVSQSGNINTMGGQPTTPYPGVPQNVYPNHYPQHQPYPNQVISTQVMPNQVVNSYEDSPLVNMAKPKSDNTITREDIIEKEKTITKVSEEVQGEVFEEMKSEREYNPILDLGVDLS